MNDCSAIFIMALKTFDHLLRDDKNCEAGCGVLY